MVYFFTFYLIDLDLDDGKYITNERNKNKFWDKLRGS